MSTEPAALGMGFERFYMPPHTAEFLRASVVSLLGDRMNDIEEAVAHLMAHEARCEHYRNHVYHVALDRFTEHGMGPDVTVWHLSFKRHDRRPVHDWRKVQALKTAILGPDVEAVELYPAEDRVVDTANQYHLYAFPGQRLPFGFPAGLRTDTIAMGNSKQRPGSGA